MTEKISLFVTLILLLEIPAMNCKSSERDDYIDPNDLLNFDPVNMKMKKSSEKTDNKQQIPDTVSEHDKLSKDSTNDKLSKDSTNEKLSKESTDNIIPTLTDFSPEEEIKEKSLESRDSQIAALFRQYVMILVENLESQVGSASPVDMNLRLKVSKHDIYKLKEYGQGRRSDAYEVHEVLSQITQFATKAEKEEFRFYWLEEKLGLSATNLFLSLAVVSSIMLLVKMLQNLMFTFSLVKQIFVILCLISFFFSWISMYQKAQAEQERNILQKYTEVCSQSEDQSFLQRTFTFVMSKFSFKDDKCQEFYNAQFVNPLVKVSPLEAVAVAIVKTIVSPVGIVGSAISTFLTSTLKDLPVQWQMVVAGFIFGLVFFLICVISGYELRSIFFNIQRSPREYYQPIQNVPPPQFLDDAHQNHENRNIIQNRRHIHQYPTARRPDVPAVEGMAAPAIERLPAPVVGRIAAHVVERVNVPAVERVPVPAVGRVPAHAVEKVPAPLDRQSVLTLGLPHISDTRQDVIDNDSGTGNLKSELDDVVQDICATLSQQQIGPVVEPNLTNQIQHIEISADGCGDADIK